jgi:hypothetical protein
MNRQMVGMAALAAAMAATLAACGTNPSERTGGGAAAGAATGATIGLVGGPVGVLAGAAIGAGAGAVTGATTSPRDVNLGRPLWDNPEVHTPMDRQHRTAQNTRTRQPRATPEQDRAYMGGGMVGYPDGTGSNAPAPGTTGGSVHRDADQAPAVMRGPAKSAHKGAGTPPARTEPAAGPAATGRVAP